MLAILGWVIALLFTCWLTALAGFVLIMCKVFDHRGAGDIIFGWGLAAIAGALWWFVVIQQFPFTIAVK